jgi:KDO2-lipid IV(A) lauroyltransferase
MGRSLGRFLARFAKLRREVALANLAIAFPEQNLEARVAIYERMMAHFGTVLAEFARFTRPGEDRYGRVTVENLESAWAGLEAGRGVILLTGHFGNWEAFAAQLAREGLPVTVLGGRQRNPLVEELINRYRARVGLEPLVVGKSLRPIVTALRGGACVASLVDQDGGPGGLFMPFFGRVASVQPGLFRLAARRSIPIVTGFSVREGSAWRARFAEPDWPEPVKGPEAAEAEARRLAARYLAALETHIRDRPDHWFWVHRRWKTRPPGEGST